MDAAKRTVLEEGYVRWLQSAKNYEVANQVALQVRWWPANVHWWFQMRLSLAKVEDIAVNEGIIGPDDED